MGDITGNLVQAVLTLDNFQNARGRILKQAGFGIVQILVLDNVNNIVIQEIILQTHFRHTARVEQWHSRAVLYGLCKVILGYIVTEPLVCQALGTQQRRTRKCNEICVGQCGSHILGQILILRTVCFVDHYDDIITLGEHRIFLGFIVTELMYQRKDKGLVCLQEFAELRAVFRLAFFLVANNLGAHKVLVNLRVEIVTVGDHQEGKVTLYFTAHFPGEHNHGVTLAGALRMPEDTQFAFEFLAVLH